MKFNGSKIDTQLLAKLKDGIVVFMIKPVQRDVITSQGGPIEQVKKLKSILVLELLK